jgi:hypothetical protein
MVGAGEMVGTGEWQALENFELQPPSLTFLWPLPFKRLGVCTNRGSEVMSHFRALTYPPHFVTQFHQSFLNIYLFDSYDA